MGHVTAHEVEDLYLRRHVAFRNALTGIAGGPEAGADAMQEGFARALVSIDQSPQRPCPMFAGRAH